MPKGNSVQKTRTPHQTYGSFWKTHSSNFSARAGLDKVQNDESGIRTHALSDQILILAP